MPRIGVAATIGLVIAGNLIMAALIDKYGWLAQDAIPIDRWRILGLLLLADDRRAGDELHYAYGSLALAVALVPWFYAPEAGPRRLLWFAATTGVAGALAIRAFMTGST